MEIQLIVPPNKRFHLTPLRSLAAAEARAVMLPALGSQLVNAVGEGALEAVGIDGRSVGNLHNITNHCTRP